MNSLTRPGQAPQEALAMTDPEYIEREHNMSVIEGYLAQLPHVTVDEASIHHFVPTYQFEAESAREVRRIQAATVWDVTHDDNYTPVQVPWYIVGRQEVAENAAALLLLSATNWPSEEPKLKRKLITPKILEALEDVQARIMRSSVSMEVQKGNSQTIRRLDKQVFMFGRSAQHSLQVKESTFTPFSYRGSREGIVGKMLKRGTVPFLPTPTEKRLEIGPTNQQMADFSVIAHLGKLTNQLGKK